MIDRSDPARSPLDDDPVLVDVTRAGLIESVHHARVVVTAADGTLAWSLGDVLAPIYPRSASKPLQAIAMLEAGLDLDGELLALAAASHSGEPFHLDGTRRILAGAGLGLDALQNIADYPLLDSAKHAWIAKGRGPERVAMNCSGKHAAMLATCVANGWPSAEYLRPESPLQQRVAAVVAEYTGEALGEPTVDGCGAPLHAVSLAGLARAFGRIAAAEGGAARRLAEAYRSHPEWASGTERDEAELHRALPGVIAKAGAEAVYAVGLPDGRGVALKISDGHPRARAALMAEVLLGLGFEHPSLDARRRVAVLGHGEPVGSLSVRTRLLAGL